MRRNLILYFSSFVFLMLFLIPQFTIAQMVTEGDPLPSITPDNASAATLGKAIPPGPTLLKQSSTLQKVDKTFEGFWFQDNPTENNGFRFIPPDPIGAAGKNILVAVVNSMIEARSKGGKLKWREGLRDFYASLNPGSFPFDPKIVYDHFRDRFVVVALEQATGSFPVDPNNISRILLAVSKDGRPNNASDWNFQAINSKQIIFGSFEGWADYPGFEVDEEAVYITANIFTFVPFGFFGGVRLWIVDKEFYDGNVSGVSVNDPYANAGLATTTMPALIHSGDDDDGDDDDGDDDEDSDITGAGLGIGTYLLSYSGLSDGVDEFVQVVRVDDPLGAPVFTQEFINIGNIEDFVPGPLPDAPQLGSTFGIEVNDRRALDAVWRDNELWMVTTINPNSGFDAGQTTAHWFKLSTANAPIGAITLLDQGDIGGEDIALDTYTFFPAVEVNEERSAVFGFSASAASIFAGAYVTGKTVNHPSGTVGSTLILKEGEAPYKRFFGGTRNRWGDYSGASLDPDDDDYVWVYNEFADEQGSPSNGSQGPEDGQWGTAWGRVEFSDDDDLDKSLVFTNKAIPAEFALNQNYPNPFNPGTTIEYHLPEKSFVSIKVYNLLGKEVESLVNENKAEGIHKVYFDASRLSSGVYFYKLRTGKFVEIKKMTLLK